MPDGIVEELFIAPVPATGVSEVWFRNWSVVANLGLRAAGTLTEDPTLVAWGQTKDRFYVRTGSVPATYKYYIFRIPRSIGTIFGEGVIPSTTLERTKGPFISSDISVLALPYSVSSEAKGGDTALFVSVHQPLTSACVEGTRTFEFLSVVQASQVDVATGTQNINLGSLISSGSGVSVQAALDDSGNLILFLVAAVTSFTVAGTRTTEAANTSSCTPGLSATATSAITMSIVPRSDQGNLWIINTQTSARIYTTAGGQLLTKRHSHLGVAVNLMEHFTRSPGHVLFCPPLDTCVKTVTQGDAGGSVALSQVLSAFDVSGTESRTDNLADTSVPYVDGVVEAAFSATVSAQPAIQFIGATYGYRFPYNRETWSESVAPWTYSVERVYLLQATSPMRFLLTVKRTRGSTAQHGLFYMSDTGLTFTRIRDFTDDLAGFIALKVMTANERHALWYVEADSSTVYLTDIRTNRTRAVGTNLTQLRNYRFRLLQGDLANPVDLLWQGAEPAGRFLEGWETDGTPTLTDTGEGFPLSLLDPYSDLADLPNGIAPPVIPAG